MLGKMLGLGVDIRIQGAPPAGGSPAPITNTKSLTFDGVNDFAWVAGTSMAGIWGDGGTLAFWLKLTDYTQNAEVFSQGIGSDYIRMVHTGSTQQLAIIGYVGGVYTVFNNYNTVIQDNNWHFIVMNVNRPSVIDVDLYVDGNEVQPSFVFPTSVGTLDPAGGSRFAFAKPFNVATYYDISVDETAVWDTTLSADEILELYTYHNLAADSGNYASSSSLQRWWRFEGTISDEQGSGVKFNLVNGATYSSNVPF